MTEDERQALKERFIALLREEAHTVSDIHRMTGLSKHAIWDRTSKYREADPSIPAPLRRPRDAVTRNQAKQKTERLSVHKPVQNELAPLVGRKCLSCGDVFKSSAPRSIERVCYGCKRLPSWHDFTIPDCTINHR